MNKREVYVLDCETISALGFGSLALKKRIEDNFSAVAPITQFPPDGLSQGEACEVKEDVLSMIQAVDDLWYETALNDRKFALWAALVQKNKVSIIEQMAHFEKNRVGVVMGLGANAFPVQNITLGIQEPSAIGLFKHIETINRMNGLKGNSIFNHADIYAHYLQQCTREIGYSKNVLTACSSSTQAIAFAAARIMADEADLMIVGGTDSIINQFAYISFGKLGVLTDKTCRPFDINRSGAIAGECAGYTVLVSEQGLKHLQREPKYQLLGFGNSLDAYKITAPDPSGYGVERAMRKSLTMAGLEPHEIDYINAHGTGTRSNDEVELQAIERIAGESASSIHVSSTKDRHGHAIAAAGILEFHVLLSSMDMELVPSNLNLQKPIDTPLILPIEGNISKKIRFGMTNNFAFGGVNCSLTVKNLKL